MAVWDDGGRGGWRLPAAAIGVPVLTVAGAMLVFGALTGAGASTWEAGLAGVGVGLGGLFAGLWAVRAVRRAEGERRQRGLRAGAATWAQQNGWQVRQGQECAEETFPAHIQAPAVEPVQCDLVLQGRVGGRRVRVESWQVQHPSTGLSAPARGRRQLVRVDASERLPTCALLDGRLAPWAEFFIPAPLQVTARAGALAVAGDQAAGAGVVEPLTSFTDRIRVTGAWVILAPGEVTLAFPTDADERVLAYRVDMAAEISSVLDSTGTIPDRPGSP